MSELPEPLRAPPQRRTLHRGRAFGQTLVKLSLGALFGAAGVVVLKAFAPSVVAQSDLPAEAWSLTEWVICAALVPVAYWLVVALHEAGHLMAGRLAGFEPIGLIAGPLRLDKRHGRWQLSRNRVRTPGGLALMRPGSRALDRRAWMLYLVGGVAANGITGGMALGSVEYADGVVLALLGFFAFLSLTLGAINLLPFKAQGLRTDGANLLMLWRRDPDAQSLLLEGALTAESISGVRPADWAPEGLAAIARAAQSPGARLRAAMVLGLSALDRRDAHEAHGHFLRMAELMHADRLASVPQPMQAHYLLPVAGFLAICGEAEAAERWLNGAGNLLFDAWERDAVQALIAQARGQRDEAQQLARKALAQLPSAVDAGGAQAVKSRLEALLPS